MGDGETACDTSDQLACNVESEGNSRDVDSDEHEQKYDPGLQEDVNEPPNKRRRNDEEFDIRFLVSSKDAGAVIGKGGLNINHLRKHYKSSVTVPDCPGPERVLSIVCSLDVLGDILHDVIKNIDDRTQKNTEREIELRLLVHTSHAGGIIGRGGQRIRELREQTKAAIKVFSQCCPNSSERICAIQGVPAVVVDAIKTILDIILASPVKGPVRLYDPFNFDLFIASEYGGYVDQSPANVRSARGPTGASRRSDLVPRSWGRDQHFCDPLPPNAWVRMPPATPFDAPPGSERRGPPLAPPPVPPSPLYSRWMPQDSRGRMMPNKDSDNTPYWSDSLPASNNVGLPTSGLPPPAHHWPDDEDDDVADNCVDITDNADGSATASLTVPNSVAGAIIGKGGNRIRIVRRDSGADISIDNDSGVGKSRIITIKGSQQQVRMACSMLNRSIAENSRGRH